MKLYKKIFLLFFIFEASSLYASNYEYSGSCRFLGYMDEFEICLNKELANYDKKLNKLYRTLYSRSHNQNLKKIEGLWIKFKEADCSFIAKEVHGGLYYQIVYKACLINKTKARTADLKRSLFYSGWFEKNT